MYTDYVLMVSHKDIMSAAARSSLTPAVTETPDTDAVLTLAHGVDADANLVLIKLRACLWTPARSRVRDGFNLNARAAFDSVLKLICDQQQGAQSFRHIHSSQFHSLSLLPGLVFVVDAGFLLQVSGRGRVVGLNSSRVVTFDTIHIRLTLSRVAF